MLLESRDGTYFMSVRRWNPKTQPNDSRLRDLESIIVVGHGVGTVEAEFFAW